MLLPCPFIHKLFQCLVLIPFLFLVFSSDRGQSHICLGLNRPSIFAWILEGISFQHVQIQINHLLLASPYPPKLTQTSWPFFRTPISENHSTICQVVQTRNPRVFSFAFLLNILNPSFFALSLSLPPPTHHLLLFLSNFLPVESAIKSAVNCCCVRLASAYELRSCTSFAAPAND